MKKYINQMDMKQANASEVFSLIRSHGKLTRKEIMNETGLSWGAVSKIISRLIDEGYISDYKASGSVQSGRIPSYLEVNGERYAVIGLDINASGFKAVTVNLKNEIIRECEIKCDCTDGDSLLECIIRFARQTVEASKDRTVIGMGVAMQGLVDSENGISVKFPHIKDWKNVCLSDILSGEFDIPVFIEHDPNCILYAVSGESDVEDAILVRVDKGIGMAVMLGRSILYHTGMFEIGHTVVVPGGVLCKCGKCGCLESYASTSGMSRLAGIEFEELAAKAAGGNEESLKLFKNMAFHLALAISNEAHMFGIYDIYLCGDMWRYRELFYDDFIGHVRTLSDNADFKFRFTDTKNAAIGAAINAIDKATEIQI